jgi:5-methylcytosine-specific restriction endonuclease McrA
MSNPQCVECGLAGEEVHHVIPRAQAPNLMYDERNVQTLCRKCHVDKHLPRRD